MEIEHFSHKHPLILQLNEEQKHDGEKIQCDGCLQKISGPYYSCNPSDCKFFLHKLCAELDKQIEHPLHPDHPLILRARPPYRSRCDVCQETWSKFTYNCYQCKFYIDIICASLMERKIKHPSHDKHPLIPTRKSSLLYCHACFTKHEGIFYQCTTCHFCLHQDCASLPTTIKHNDHGHDLSLAFSLPREYSKFTSYCDICEEKLQRLCWFYYCRGCRYMVHINCATSRIEAFMSILQYDRKTKIIPEDIARSLIHLPVPDEYASPISHFFKMNQKKNNRAQELTHFSHEHPLILLDVQNNDKSCAESKVCLPKELKNEKICDGCIEPIFTEYYSCPQCNFFLHEWCAELPTEVHDHPFHPQHTLTLLPKSHDQSVGLFKCQCCGIHYNGFRFGCPSCKFYVDINCAWVPGAIIHEAHAHDRLSLTQNMRGLCKACYQYGYMKSGFKCDTCDFKLHLKCALLPRKVRHRYEKHHPLSLTYTPFNDGSDEFFCEICEEDLNPKAWFYHSGSSCDCNQWFHATCILPKRGAIKFDDHPHTLTYALRRPRDDFLCDRCFEPLSTSFVFFECSACEYKIHGICPSKNETKVVN